MTSAVEYFSSATNNFYEDYFVNPDLRERLGLWFLLINKYAKNNMIAYDIGCGPGLMTFYLASFVLEAKGLDASADMIAYCNNKNKMLNLKNLSFEQQMFPFKNLALPPCDLILCSSMLEYMDDIELSIQKICLLMNANGIFIFSLPNASSLYRKYEYIKSKYFKKQEEYYRYVKNILSLKDTIRILSNNSLEVLEYHYYSHYYNFTKFLSCFLPKQFSNNLFVIVCKKTAHAK